MTQLLDWCLLDPFAMNVNCSNKFFVDCLFFFFILDNSVGNIRCFYFVVLTVQVAVHPIQHSLPVEQWHASHLFSTIAQTIQNEWTDWMWLSLKQSHSKTWLGWHSQTTKKVSDNHLCLVVDMDSWTVCGTETIMATPTPTSCMYAGIWQESAAYMKFISFNI